MLISSNRHRIIIGLMVTSFHKYACVRHCKLTPMSRFMHSGRRLAAELCPRFDLFLCRAKIRLLLSDNREKSVRQFIGTRLFTSANVKSRETFARQSFANFLVANYNVVQLDTAHNPLAMFFFRCSQRGYTKAKLHTLHIPDFTANV